MGKYLFGIKFKDYRISKDDKTGIVDASIQFGTDDMHWYILSWLLKNGFAWVRVSPKDYLEYIENGKKDLVHFHLPSKVMPTEELMRILAKIVVKYIYMIEHGKEPTVMDSEWRTLSGIFNIKSPSLKFYMEDSFNVMARMIKELDKNEFRPMISINNDDGIETENNWSFLTIVKLYNELNGNKFRPKWISDNNDINNSVFNVLVKKYIYKELNNNKFSKGIGIGYGKGIYNVHTNTTDYSNCKVMYNLYRDTFSVVTGYSSKQSSITDPSYIDPDNQKIYAATDSMESAFTGCGKLKEIPYIYNFDKVTNTDWMFGWNWTYNIPGGDGSNSEGKWRLCGCESIITIPLLDTSNVTSMQYMFAECYSLKTIPLINTSKVKNMCGMFIRCKSLESVPLLDTSNVISMQDMFDGCYSLKTIPQFNTEKVIDMRGMFSFCKSMETIPKLNTSNVTRMDEIFSYYCTDSFIHNALQKFSNTDNVNYINYMFSYNTNIEEIDMLEFNKNSIKNIKKCRYLFNNCKKLISVHNIVLSNNTTDVYGMFDTCHSLTTLDVSNWDTSNITDIRHIFHNCSSLITLDVSKWNTSNVTSMRGMFAGCKSLTSLDVSNWDTSSVTDMQEMFAGCNSFTSLDVSNWDTSKVKDIRAMFAGCNSLTSLDVSNWDTSSVTNMMAMFNGCTNLTTIIGEIDMTSCTNYENMFVSCTKLKNVKLKNVPKDFDASKARLSAGQYTILSYRS